MEHPDPEIKEFGTAHGAGLIPFKLNGNPGEAFGTLPVNAFLKFIGLVNRLATVAAQQDTDTGTDDDFDVAALEVQMKMIGDAVAICMTPESARMILDGFDDPTNPVDVPTLQEILQWLLAEYKMAAKDTDEDEPDVDEVIASGERPTLPTSDSATTSSPTGVGSADS